AKLKAYRFGGDASALDALTQQVAEARSDPARKRQIARDLSGVLSTDASFDAKQFACRQLALVAGEEEVPALAALLANKEMAHYALLALARIPGKAVNDALFAGRKRGGFETEWEILDTLADRGDTRITGVCAEMLGASSPAAVEAAASALAKLPDNQA